MLLIIVIGLFLISYFGDGSDEILYYAELFGVISAIAVLLQFTPQIYLTYKLKVFIFNIIIRNYLFYYNYFILSITYNFNLINYLNIYLSFHY